jgi:hypothetical protein
MTHTVIFMFILAMCVTFLICAFRAEDKAWEWEKKYRKLRSDIVFLEYELTPTVRDGDPEFLAGWNMAMGKAKSMIERVLKDA